MDLVGIKGVCEPKAGAIFWLNDTPGIKVENLAQLADQDNPTGKKFGESIIERAARLLIADIEGIMGSGYQVAQSITTGCSTCAFTNLFSTGVGLGVVVKNNSGSQYSNMVIDSLLVRINNTGTYTIVLDDGLTTKEIPYSFTALEEVEFRGVNFRTEQKRVRIYFKEVGVQLSQLLCTPEKGCGCSGGSKNDHTITFAGTQGGTDQALGYGFIPCANIVCDSELLMCNLAKAAPRLMGLTLLLKASELYFAENVLSTRNNRVASMQVEEKDDAAASYRKSYQERLQGKGVRGVKDAVLSVLKNQTDRCIICDNIIRTAWATG